MKKRGQIYIIAALILIIVIYGVAAVVNTVEQKKLEGSFERLANNFESEAARTLNSVLVSPPSEDPNPPFGTFEKFTVYFTSYSKAQNPNFGLIYVLNYGEKTVVGNFLDKEILIDDGFELTEKDGCFEKVSATIIIHGLSSSVEDVDMTNIKNLCIHEVGFTPSELWICIEDSCYKFVIKPNQPEIMIVSRMEAEEQRRVFIGGEGFEKEDKTYCSSFSQVDCTSGERSGICCWEGACVFCED